MKGFYCITLILILHCSTLDAGKAECQSIQGCDACVESDLMCTYYEAGKVSYCLPQNPFPPTSWNFEAPPGGVCLPTPTSTPAPGMEHFSVWFWMFITIIIVLSVAFIAMLWKQRCHVQHLPIMGWGSRNPFQSGEVTLRTYESVL